MQDVDLSVAEMRRCKNETSIVGFEIGTTIEGANLDDKKFDILWATAQELGRGFFASQFIKIMEILSHSDKKAQVLDSCIDCSFLKTTFFTCVILC